MKLKTIGESAYGHSPLHANHRCEHDSAIRSESSRKDQHRKKLMRPTYIQSIEITINDDQ